MKTNFAKTTVSTVVMALAALGAASSFAANVPTDAVGNKTRAEVRAEYLQAVKNGEIVSATEGTVLVAPAFVSTKTRAEVRAEYLQAVKSGQIVQATEGAMLVGPAFVSTHSRAEVRAEAVAAAHNPAFPIN